MNEGSKTAIFVGVALVLSLASYASIPKPEKVDLEDKVGKNLFEFDDPTLAASLEIIRYDEDLGEAGSGGVGSLDLQAAVDANVDIGLDHREVG